MIAKPMVRFRITHETTAMIMLLHPRRQPPLVALMPEPPRGPVSRLLAHDENEVGSRRVMVAPATPPP